MIGAVVRYRALRARLRATRDEKGDDSPEEEQILDDMDDLWWEMSEDEKELFHADDPAGDRREGAAMSNKPLPMQPVTIDKNGRARFRRNKLVEHLLDNGGLDLNKLALVECPPEDREQLAQLIGYSVAGYHELSYVTDESAARASALAREIDPKHGGCRDDGCEIHGGPLEAPRPPGPSQAWVDAERRAREALRDSDPAKLEDAMAALWQESLRR